MAAANGSDEHSAEAALELVRRGIDLVQHLDPAGVGARDLRECLLLQISAQQQEFSHLYGDAALRDRSRILMATSERRSRSQARRAAPGMEVAAIIVDHHLPLLQKRDVKDLARAAQVTVEEAQPASSLFAPSIRVPAAFTTANNAPH